MQVLPPVCLLDTPLCHSATNGHCWASHFLNDTLLRSIQLLCSYTLSLLPPFFLPPYRLRWLPLMYNAVAPLSHVEEKEFLVNYLSIFSTQHASWWKIVMLYGAHALLYITYQWLDNWQCVTGVSSPCWLQRTHQHNDSFIHHPPPPCMHTNILILCLLLSLFPLLTKHHLSLLLIIFISLHVCVRLCVCLCVCVWAAEGGVAHFLYCKLY